MPFRGTTTLWLVCKEKVKPSDHSDSLTLIAPITTAADDKFCDIFANFQRIANFRKKGMMFHENRLPADDSHEISFFICYF